MEISRIMTKMANNSIPKSSLTIVGATKLKACESELIMNIIPFFIYKYLHPAKTLFTLKSPMLSDKSNSP